MGWRRPRDTQPRARGRPGRALDRGPDQRSDRTIVRPASVGQIPQRIRRAALQDATGGARRDPSADLSHRDRLAERPSDDRNRVGRPENRVDERKIVNRTFQRPPLRLEGDSRAAPFNSGNAQQPAVKLVRPGIRGARMARAMAACHPRRNHYQNQPLERTATGSRVNCRSPARAYAKTVGPLVDSTAGRRIRRRSPPGKLWQGVRERNNPRVGHSKIGKLDGVGPLQLSSRRLWLTDHPPSGIKMV